MAFISVHGEITYHLTPWNSRVLNGSSLEIDEILSAKENEEYLLINDFLRTKENEGVALIAARISAVDNVKKKALLDNNFYIVEHTLEVVNYQLDRQKIELLCNRFPVTVAELDIMDLEDVSNIAYSEFNFGRFFEDPYISEMQARDRNKFWIQDLVDLECKINVLKKKNKVVGFMAYKVKNQVAELILGGVKEQYRHLSYGFWANTLLHLSEYKEIKTLISSSNVDVLNLYSFFAFKFGNPQFGFHKRFF